MWIPVLPLLLFHWIQSSTAEIYAIRFDSQFYFEEFEDAPATFGRKLSEGVVRAILVNADPPDGCTDALNPPPLNVTNETGKWAVLMPRFTQLRNCSFEQKVRIGQAAGYDAVIIHNVNSNSLVPMSAKNATGIYIPSVFVGESAGLMLKKIYADPKYFIVITGESPFNIQTHLLIPFAIVVGICFIVMIIFMVVKCIKDRRRQRRHRLPTSTLNKIPTCKYQKGDPYETCAICLDDYVEGEKLRVLPCNHVYHTKCIDPWLTKNRRVCPICKRKVFAHDEPHHDSDSDSEADDTTPLINSSNRGTQGGTFQEQTENPIQRAARSVSQQSGAANYVVTTSDHHSINGDYRRPPRSHQHRNGHNSNPLNSSTSTVSSTSSGSDVSCIIQCESDLRLQQQQKQQQEEQKPQEGAAADAGGGDGDTGSNTVEVEDYDDVHIIDHAHRLPTETPSADSHNDDNDDDGSSRNVRV